MTSSVAGRIGRGSAGGALAGLTVLDLTQGVAGPYCTRLLAGYGAGVLKVERPGRGDVSRRAGPFSGDRPDPERSGLFLHLNSAKRSITLDMQSLSGRAIFLRLLEDADLVVESYRIGTMDRFGLGYDDLAPRKPDLVYVSISNFGQSGPYRDYEALDVVLQAIGGPNMYSQGMPGRGPLKYPGNTGQYFAGVTAALAATGAVFAARAQGVGQHVDISIAQALMGSPEHKPIEYLYTGKVVGREANAARYPYLMGAYPCKDGYIGLQGSGRGETWWPRVYRLIGMPDLVDDPRFSTPEAREANRDEFDVFWYSWLADHTRAEVFAAAQEARFPLAPVYTPEDLVNDSHYRARGFFDKVAQPRVGCVAQAGGPFKMHGTPWRGARPAPLLGQHNTEVYIGTLGMAPHDLARLRAAGVI